MKRKVIVPLPAREFDPSEVAIPWSILSIAGIEVVFATPDGQQAHCDQRMLDGQGLGIWRELLRADSNARLAYAHLEQDRNFQKPILWSDIQVNDYDGLLLPGGHAPAMREYIEAKILQQLVAQFFASNKLVAVICHGLLLAARSLGPDGKSVLYNKKLTGLLRTQELTAWGLTCLWLGNYYRTYPETVQSEVTRLLKSPEQFIPGPLPLLRDNLNRPERGFVVQDGNLISARWPGDVHAFGLAIKKYLSQSETK